MIIHELTGRMLRQITWIMLTSSLLLACHEAVVKKDTHHSVIVEKKTLHHMLYFTGVLQPLHENAVTSTVDAVVDGMAYHYGQLVKKGEVIFTLNSAELQHQYHDTLTEYLKAKDNYAMTKARFTGTEDLWAAGLLSKNNYLSEKSNLNTGRVSLMQATRKLSELLEKMGDKPDEALSNLSFEEFEGVRQALSRPHNLIQLKAVEDGVLLYPPKATDNSARITVGSAIKAGQVLALLGDLSGVRVEIDVPEVDINQIKVGMPAAISGVAFGKEILHGSLVAINAQASSQNGAPLPSFTATVEVHRLTPRQQSLLKVGMSAAVELSVDSSEQILVPVACVHQQHDKRMVRLIEKKSISDRVVVTGAVHEDSVVIESGLHVGDVLSCP